MNTTNKYTQLFETIARFGNSKATKSKVNFRLKALGYTDNQIGTARALIKGDIAGIANPDQDITQNHSIWSKQENKVLSDLKSSNLEDILEFVQEDSSVSIKERTLKKLAELRKIKESLSLVDTELDQLITDVLQM